MARGSWTDGKNERKDYAVGGVAVGWVAINRVGGEWYWVFENETGCESSRARAMKCVEYRAALHNPGPEAKPGVTVPVSFMDTGKAIVAACAERRGTLPEMLEAVDGIMETFDSHSASSNADRLDGPERVVVSMIAMKLARRAGGEAFEETWNDIAGYLHGLDQWHMEQ